MATLQEINQHFDLNELERQLQTVLTFQDPVGYMQSNINWEIDKEDLDDTPELGQLTQIMAADLSANKMYGPWNPFQKFLNWFSRNRTAKKVKNGLCGIADEIQRLIDEEAELKKLLEAALLAIAAGIGIGAINPVLLTILVGILATMILKGVSSVCGF
ncbi:hypothetical protein OQ279_14840 [Salinimicrobium sp. MT39]|uniref:Uncharacterized protein n=1 Tax=Salinimicrobium profundisediminis TaxID=2994553 RepID=A0A9X3CYZ5_9FLAO|nr:hypothetical protein [Salinimicrobium profundisediminis]MCX2839426.1 hypothetical protein [Salinimicrobium profundisediminis]